MRLFCILMNLLLTFIKLIFLERCVVKSASPLKRSAFIVDLRQDFSLLMQLNVLSHSADVSSKVRKILSNLFTLGKRLLSQALSALATVFGLSFSAIHLAAQTSIDEFLL